MKFTIDPFGPQREVSFFLRIHGHLPDKICGGNAIFSDCEYRQDGVPINHLNDYVEELRKNPEYVAKEKEVQETQMKGKSIKIKK